MKLTEIKLIKGKIVLQTGLRIGADKAQIQIGGIDNPVVKHPKTGEPYIPGSSLKGKIRSLLEWKTGEIKSSNPLSAEDYERTQREQSASAESVKIILQLFGIGGDSQKTVSKDDAQQTVGKNEKTVSEKIGHTRLAFWDCSLSEESKKAYDAKSLRYTEDKIENSINRISGTATNPRHSERVPAGMKFDFCVSLKVFEGDDDEKLLTELYNGLKLLEMDSLGGSGSRGYGKVKFELDDGLTLPENPFV